MKNVIAAVVGATIGAGLAFVLAPIVWGMSWKEIVDILTYVYVR